SEGTKSHCSQEAQAAQKWLAQQRDGTGDTASRLAAARRQIQEGQQAQQRLSEALGRASRLRQQLSDRLRRATAGFNSCRQIIQRHLGDATEQRLAQALEEVRQAVEADAFGSIES